MLQKTQQQEVIDIIDIARQALEQAGGDAYKGAKVLEGMARKDVAIANELLMPLLHQASYDAIRKVCIRERGYVARHADSVVTSMAKTSAKSVQSHATRLMAFLLPLGQKKLQDATRTDVEANADFYRKQARTMSQRGRWLEMVANEVTGKKQVKAALTEDRLFALWQEAAA